MKCMCLQAMSIVYGRYYEDIGMFSDTKYIVGMLERVRKSNVEICGLILVKLLKLNTEVKYHVRNLLLTVNYRTFYCYLLLNLNLVFLPR